jgi:hypothetical protein
MLKRISDVQPLDNYCLLLTFNDEEKRVYDMAGWLDKPYFQPLKEISFFRNVWVNPITRTVEWEGERDLCPDMLYEDSQPVS